MKNLRNFFSYMLCLAIALTALSSCLNGDDEKELTLTDADVRTIFETGQGTYEGKIYTVTENYAGTFLTKDSVRNVQLTINADSTIRVSGIPDSLYASLLDSYHAQSKAVSEELAKQTTVQPVRSKIGALSYYDRDKTIYSYQTLIYQTTFTVTLNGQAQQVVFKNSMFALYNTRNRALQVAMKPAEIKAEKEYLRPSRNYFIFVSTAKH